MSRFVDWADVAALGVMIRCDLHPWRLPELVDTIFVNPYTDGPARDARHEQHFIAKAIREAYEAGHDAGCRDGQDAIPEPMFDGRQQDYPHLFELVCGTTEHPIGGPARDELLALICRVHEAGVHQGLEQAKRVCEEYQLPEWNRWTPDECQRSNRLADPTLVADDCSQAIGRLIDEY